jgi:hypothetical protein
VYRVLALSAPSDRSAESESRKYLLTVYCLGAFVLLPKAPINFRQACSYVASTGQISANFDK